MLPNFYVVQIKTIINGSGSNHKSKDDEHMRKEEYLKREEVIQLSDICANKKVQQF